jgi:hypothetical protein
LQPQLKKMRNNNKKTNLLLFTAFILMLIFAGMTAFPASAFNCNSDKYSVTTQKRNNSLERQVRSTPPQYSIFEVCEEETEDEDESAKFKIPVLLIAFFSFLKRSLDFSKSDILFDLTGINFHSKKYLAISVLRI